MKERALIIYFSSLLIHWLFFEELAVFYIFYSDYNFLYMKMIKDCYFHL